MSWVDCAAWTAPVPAASAAGEPWVSPSPYCDGWRAEAEKTRGELAESEKADAAKDCVGVLRSETWVFRDGSRVSRVSGLAWVCDGKIVDIKESVHTEELANRLGLLLSKMKDDC